MATGYTTPLHDGTPITFEQFVLRCSRAMGAAIMQRDESPDVEIRERELAPWYLERVAESETQVREAVARTESEWAELQDAAIADAEAHREKYLADQAAMRERYEAMLAQVRAWRPPTEEHFGLKTFMIEQIESSIRFDCGDYVPSVPVRTSPDLYGKAEIARLTKAHAREVQSLAEERERVAGQNAWVRALGDSLAS